MTRNAKPNTILIVTEPANTQGILLDYLKGFGFDIFVANDGESALKIAKQKQPDIILLDAVLPGIDGFETCRRLKATKNTRHIPVIFITAFTNTVDKVRGFMMGAVDYIARPIHSEEVLARVRTHLTIQTLQKNLSEQNARLQAEIEEREKLIAELDAYAHTVAHDLKNPLGVTMNYAQFLKKYYHAMSPEDQAENLDHIVSNGHKMRNIIDELLLLSSVRTEDVSLEPLDMAEIVSEARNRLGYLISQYEAEVFIPEDYAWPASWGYAPWIEEVWMNYLSNAMKYGGTPPRVEVGAAYSGNGLVKFWVKDNGNGLSPTAQEKLFVPFSRLSQVKIEGHGLGLSIVRRIIHKLGGEVGVESQGKANEGSLFSFSLLAHPPESHI